MSKGLLNSNADKYRHPFFYLSILLIILCITYWPLSFHVFSLKNDALNYFLPVRHLVSEAYNNHTLPLWTPYLNLGYPLHGDMQSGVWNPFVQLFSLFGPYSLYTLQIETVLYIYIGGIGMFFLLKHFSIHPYANLLASAGYMLCGFNSDGCQYLNWIAGTAFLPFIFLFYYRCLQEKSLPQGIYAGTALFFLFTCAYPADFIITVYVMAALLIVQLVSAFRKKDKTLLKNFLLPHLLLAFVFIILSAPAILSYIESLPLQERGNGAGYDEVMSNPLHPALLSSYTTPLGIWKMPGVSVTDPLERNSYIGIAGFILLIVAFLTRQKNNVTKFSKWATVIFLLFSLGELGGLRVLSYYLLPLMNTFRHPANARMFTIFFSCILAGYTFNSIIKNEISIGKIKKGWWVAIVVMLAVFIYSFFTPFSLFRFETLSQVLNPGSGSSFTSHIKTQLAKISFADLVVINTILQIPFLYFLYQFLLKKPNLKLFTTTAILNCVLFTSLFLPFTVIRENRASYTQSLINKASVKGYPLPDANKTLEENSIDNEKYLEEIGCLNLYNKKTGRSDYRITPCNLLSQNEFWFHEGFRRMMMRYPLLYKADFIYDAGKWEIAKNDSVSKWAFRKQFKAIHEYPRTDSVTIKFTGFEPNRFEGIINTPGDGEFVLMQNYYPRWKLYIDGKAQPIELTNLSFMGFSVPKGDHQFVFRYEVPGIRITFIISLVSLGLILLLAAIRSLKSIPILPS